MYNMFSKEKKEKEIFEKNVKDKKEKVSENIKRLKSSKLIENYDNRIKNFLFDMAKNPIKIQDYISPIESFRKVVFKEGTYSTKVKPFIFKTFQTEKQRIERYLMEKRSTEASVDKKDLNRKDSFEKFVQPQMRFKARNRIERVFDVINDQSFGKLDRNLVLSHLKTRLKRKVGVKNYTEYLEQQLPKYLSTNILKLNKERENERKKGEGDDEEKFFIRTFTNFYNDGQNQRNSLNSTTKSIIKQNLNSSIQESSQAMNLLNDNHIKTHFKAACNYAVINQKKLEMPKIVNSNNLFQSNHQKSISRNKSQNKSQKNFPQNSLIKNNDKITSLLKEDMNKDMIKNLTILYTDNTNNELKENNGFDEDVLKKLKKMAEKPFLNEKPEINKPKDTKAILRRIFKRKKNNNILNTRFGGDIYRTSMEYFEKENKSKNEDQIIIDNKLYTKDQTDLISKEILIKCNYFHEKNKNNSRSLKTGNGKSMITGGLTLSEFNNKHNFKKNQ